MACCNPNPRGDYAAASRRMPAKRLTRRELARWPLPLGIDALDPAVRRELLSALEVS